jgi:hypothetical protein
MISVLSSRRARHENAARAQRDQLYLFTLPTRQAEAYERFGFADTASESVLVS